MTSEKPQTSILGSQLSIVYILMIYMRKQCIISRFVHDKKLAGIVNCLEDTKELLGKLDKLSQWANTWDVQLNLWGHCQRYLYH